MISAEPSRGNYLSAQGEFQGLSMQERDLIGVVIGPKFEADEAQTAVGIPWEKWAGATRGADLTRLSPHAFSRWAELGSKNRAAAHGGL
jgi:hypothetical protein